MYPVERVHQVELSAAGSSGDTIIVPWTCEEAIQYLACNVYRSDNEALGGGSAQLIRNSEPIGSATAFAGNTIILPAYGLTVAAGDIELGYMHPQTSKQSKLVSRFAWDPVAAAVVETKATSLDQLVPQFTTSVKIINTDATKKTVLVHWCGLVWRAT